MATITRKDFLTGNFESSEYQRNSINSSLDEYTSPLTRLQVAHLIRRMGFGVNPALIDKYVNKTAGEVVNLIFVEAENNTNPTPPHFVKDSLRNPEKLSGSAKSNADAALNAQKYQYNSDLQNYWLELMQANNVGFAEKMTLFWHGHFATQYSICNTILATSMYLQNDIFRKNFIGNFKTLLQKITVDGAMLKYLNGSDNNSDSPNENYAREFLELFTIGVGNYTEQDIKEAAKILTGWKVFYFADESQTPFIAQLSANQFDSNNKSFMGEVFTVNYEVTQENVMKNSINKLVDTVLTKKGMEAANFMCTKLYKYFVYANPQAIDTALISKFADLLLANNFEFKPTLKTLFKSQHFFDDLNIGNQIKSPADIMVGITKQISYDTGMTKYMMKTLGLELLNPPNVAGWKGYRTWVSSKSLPLAVSYLNTILDSTSDTVLGDWAKKLKNYNDANGLINSLNEIFLARKVSDDRLQGFTKILLANSSISDWQNLSKDSQMLGKNVKIVLKEIFKSPDFYLI